MRSTATERTSLELSKNARCGIYSGQEQFFRGAKMARNRVEYITPHSAVDIWRGETPAVTGAGYRPHGGLPLSFWLDH